MKIPYSYIQNHIDSDIDIEELSEKFFQLGHEHELEDKIFNFELTPNRGDCLSLNGLLRELKVFYNLSLTKNTYESEIPNFDFNFINSSPSSCPKITFLKIEIENEIKEYHGELKDYFEIMRLNKNNFFTDISNYISFETGQPTHCYDLSKLGDKIEFSDVYLDEDIKFRTLLDTSIYLSGQNSVFKSSNEIINLAGIVGNKQTCCSLDTRSVIVECAYFNPESIIGKSIKYDVKSEAAHKFERGVDINCHEKILRRFLHLVDSHSTVKSVGLFSHSYEERKPKKIPYDLEKISKIVGITINEDELKKMLSHLSFEFINNEVSIPSFRNDIQNENDLAEEVARIIGYNSIPNKTISLKKNIDKDFSSNERKIKNFLIEKGFYEVINFPFVNEDSKNAIVLDNPLDSNKKHLRLGLKDSLISNLLYNERRQKDSVKIFEFSNIYSQSDYLSGTKKIGIIASGRVGKNHEDFSKKINDSYLNETLKPLSSQMKFEKISRSTLNSKLKSEILYTEIDLLEISKKLNDFYIETNNSRLFNKYEPISSFPLAVRDISFSLRDLSNSEKLQNLILNYENDIIKEVYIFDFYHNKVEEELKIGFRFTFQSVRKTLEDNEVETVIQNIINEAFKIKSVSVPGL